MPFVNGLDDGFGVIAEVIDRVVINGVLMNLKIYDIDAKRFFEDFYQRRYFHWDEDFEKVQDAYMLGNARRTKQTHVC